MTDNWDRSFSWSKINTYNTCPRQFKFKYVDELEEDEDLDDMGRTDGINFHEYMEKYYNNVRNEPTVDVAVGLAQDMFEPQFQARYRPWIEQWHDFNVRIYERLGEEYWKPVYTEKWIENELEGDLDTKYIDTPHWEGDVHHGYIDAIWWDPEEDGYGVVDYKPNAKEHSRIKGQTTYYAKVLVEVEELLDEPVEWAGTYGYKDGRFKKWNVAWQSIKALRKKVDRLKTLDNGFEPNFGFHCDWCPYMEECMMEEQKDDSLLSV